MASRSPTAATPLRKPSSAPETPMVGEPTNTAPQPVPFPPPQTFDIIPPLHGLLLRLLSAQTAGEGGSRTAGEAGGEAPSGSSGPGQGAQQQTSATGSGLAPLTAKNLPTEASSIKIRIQKAHAVVESLPDIGRSVAEQEKEIEELENRIARLNAVISDFGKRADTGA
ncbi:hypothetical protein ALT_1832 [Aspergillus lentulus]|uniref:Mediator of RNA polymerase II transcription subunit 9 n=1 Tax=Aspergillus lentulus TaxID=293939 RepID=A0AAN6BJC1_ASPLE|nr:hypothetical protein CNMCM6069_000776 [Aspergillus lentulus]KAF4157042.1 hypothetical protein CNMCM6936_005880 [Aspergillus lentulus]KAF4170351.1 hypothetical protein CNMCM8060_005903 [Aspergillus lentulus]KAF4180658.1 hypothetical protein CNMCM7927_001076 [Aspergillus lentulus]KAF4192345.1 hypothetical protein CNMCM8694_000534 [Aspergillus lentulus]